jgi:signal transduction histidine kinase
LRKVFYHVIANAVKYTPDGGSITISAKSLPDQADLPAGGIEIVVSDTGIGIDPSFHDLIFKKFYQTGQIALHSTGKTKFGGGRAWAPSCRELLKRTGGRVWVESTGTTSKRTTAGFVVCPAASRSRLNRKASQPYGSRRGQ